MQEVHRSSVIDMQPFREQRQELQRLHKILLASQEKPLRAWSEESTIILKRETYDATMAELVPMVANFGLEEI